MANPWRVGTPPKGTHSATGQESREFHERVRRGFQELAAGEPSRWLVIDATLPIEEVGRIVWERVRRLPDKAASQS